MDETPPPFSVNQAYYQALQRITDLTAALQSIANNSCCSGCQEAALVARAALRQIADGAPETTPKEPPA
jgi:hypothetical protein